MIDFRMATQTPVELRPGLKDTLPTSQERYAALAICATLIVAATAAALFGQVPGPNLKSYVAIAATIWSIADILTAFLLLVQFYISGTLLFGILSGAYAFSGCMTWAYLFAFPGVMRTTGLGAGEQQITIMLWMTWHLTFPALVMYATIMDRRRTLSLSRRRIRTAASAIVVAPIAASVAVSMLVTNYSNSLPRFVIGHHFTPIWQGFFLPAVIAVNVLACIVLLRQRGQLTALSLWLAVAMFSAILDGLLNLDTFRFSYAWDIGKLITVVTASVVLIMILCDLVGVYGRVARVDDLTSLENRHAFDERFKMLFYNAHRLRGSVALLFVDVDLFERYRDRYGEQAADACLRRVAWELVGCATRPLDIVARYGGEQFAVVLPDTPLAGVMVTAERIRSAVESLALVHREKSVGGVTVSVGIGYTSDAAGISETALSDAADRALSKAMDRGGNKVVLGNTDSPELGDSAQAEAGVARVSA